MTVKTEICIEKLVQWAYRDELSKRHTSAAEGLWDQILRDGQMGGTDDRGHGAAQRYCHFGLPDPDAEAIERAVGALEDTVIDWEQSFDTIAAELSALITVNDVRRDRERQGRTPKAGFGAAGKRAVEAFYGKGAARPVHDRPRDVILVGGMRTAALVTMHAIKGTRPDWIEDTPEPKMVMNPTGGSNAKIEGECRGRNLYTPGSYCPLKWEPSPLSIVQSRAEYAAWHFGLVTLASRLNLTKFTPLPPKASPTPWLENTEPGLTVLPVLPDGINSVSSWGTLPLAPTRGRMGPPLRHPKAGPVRPVDIQEAC